MTLAVVAVQAKVGGGTRLYLFKEYDNLDYIDLLAPKIKDVFVYAHGIVAGGSKRQQKPSNWDDSGKLLEIEAQYNV